MKYRIIEKHYGASHWFEVQKIFLFFYLTITKTICMSREFGAHNVNVKFDSNEEAETFIKNDIEKNNRLLLQ